MRAKYKIESSLDWGGWPIYSVYRKHFGMWFFQCGFGSLSSAREWVHSHLTFKPHREEHP